MLITTQFLLEYSNSMYVRIENNTGMSLHDAKYFLCNLVNQNSEEGSARFCDTDVAKNIVTELELLPLSILAASDHIKRMMWLNPLYSCKDYLPEYTAVLDILPAHNASVTGYQQSMLASLQLTITNASNVYSDVYRDFIALIGFATVKRKSISVEHVRTYLETMKHGSESYGKILNFPLVYFSKEESLFYVHQVTGYAFRKALERDESYNSLQYILRSISYYFANQYSESQDYQIIEHYSDLLQNLPTRYPHVDDCLIQPDSEHIKNVCTVIFETYSAYYLLRYGGMNCL